LYSLRDFEDTLVCVRLRRIMRIVTVPCFAPCTNILTYPTVYVKINRFQNSSILYELKKLQQLFDYGKGKGKRGFV